MGKTVSGAKAKRQTPRAQAAPATLSPTEQAVVETLCIERSTEKSTDYLRHDAMFGSPETTFPDTYATVHRVLQSNAAAFMDQGVQSVMISSRGNGKSGSMHVTAWLGNTGPVIGILNNIRDQLQQHGVNAIADPDYACPNYGGASRAIRIDITR